MSSQEGSAPVISQIEATFAFPITTYEVTVTDPDGDPLTYEWTKSGERTCGDFTSDGAAAQWSHPHPPCPEEEHHPSTITVTVNDGQWSTTASYTDGSKEGIATFASSPAIPIATTTTTTTAATTSSAVVTTARVAAPSPGTDDGGSGTLPILGIAVLVLLVATALWWWRRRRSTRTSVELTDEQRDLLTEIDRSLTIERPTDLDDRDRLLLYLARAIQNMDQQITEITAHLEELLRGAPPDRPEQAVEAARIENTVTKLEQLTKDRARVSGLAEDLNRHATGSVQELGR